jgi:hypothetical protein
VEFAVGLCLIAVVVLLVAFGVFGAFERLAALSWSPWAFRSGVRVMKRSWPLPADTRIPEAGFLVANGRVAFTHEGELVFLCAGGTPAGDAWALRGTITIAEDEACVVGRVSASTVGFGVAMEAFIVILALWLTLDSGSLLLVPISILSAVVYPVVTLKLGIPLLVARADCLLDGFFASVSE